MTATHFFNMRLSPEEQAGLAQCAADHGVKRSRLVRRLIRELIRQRPDYFEIDQNNIREMNRQLSAIGRNLNQIARKLNTEQGAGTVEIDEALADVKAGVTSVRQFIGHEISASIKRTASVMKEP